MRKDLLLKIFVFSFCLILIALFWRNVISNINKTIYDWNDGPFSVWVIQNDIRHFRTFDVLHLFETNAMYSFPYSLSFAEHFFFPSFIVLLISVFSGNQLFQFNFLSILDHFFIFISFYLLISLFIKNFWARIISSFYMAFSPYVFAQFGHVQMIFFWPFLLALYFLVKNEQEKQKQLLYLVLGGVFLGFQFLSAVYLGLIGLTIIGLYYLAEIVYKKNFVEVAKKIAVILGVFLLVSGYSIYGYLIMQREYKPVRDAGEYIVYSAHITDYLFPTARQGSFLYDNNLMARWDKFNHHGMGEIAAFIGFLPSVLILFYFFHLGKKENKIHLSISVDKTGFFLLAMLICGFIFSLGTRLSVNGSYLHIPLPYNFLLKILPPLGIMRALARWFFLVILASGLITGIVLDRMFIFIKKKKMFSWKIDLVGFVILLFAVLEFYPKMPIIMPSSATVWWNDSYNYLSKNLCKSEKNTLLEYPFEYRNTDGDIVKNLRYKSGILLASTYHDCKVLSGFTAFEPPLFIKYKNEIDSRIDKNTLDLMKKIGIEYVKINKNALSGKDYRWVKESFERLNYRPSYEDKYATIYRINN